MLIFQQPHWLWALAFLPVLVVWLLWVQRRYWVDAFHFSQVSLLKLVEAHPHVVWTQRIVPLCLLGAMACCVVGLAHPALQTREATPASAVMLTLDISLSMEATDIAPNRLEAEKQAAIRFIQTLPAETRTGLTLFSGNTYLASPLTTDHEGVISLLSQLDSTDLRSGTALGDAVLTSLDSFSPLDNGPQAGTQAPGKALVLMTDGENNMGLGTDVAQAEARRLKIPVFTVGLGETEGATIRKGLFTRLDESTLETLALQTGGAYFRVRKFSDFRKIYEPLAQKANLYRQTQVSLVPLCGVACLVFLLVAFGWGVSQRRF